MTARLLSGLAVFAAGLTLAGAALAGVEYVYDSSGRLIRVTYSSGVSVEYRYDSAGNRIAVNRTTGAGAAPNAVNDAATAVPGTAVNIQVRANDTDPQGNGLTITSVGQPSAGGVTIESAGTYVRYTPPAASGVYHFNYAVTDSAGGMDAATVAVTVSAPAPNQPPNAVNDYYELTTANTTPMTFVANVRANDTDPEGQAITLTSVSQPTNSASASVQNGSVTLTNLRVGSTTFSYTISDGHGGTDTGSVTISRTWEPGESCGGPGQPICP